MGIRTSIFRSANRRQLNPQEFIEQLANNGAQNIPPINQYTSREQNQILRMLMLGMLSSVQEMVTEREDNQKKICLLSEEVIKLKKELSQYQSEVENPNPCILCYDNQQEKTLNCCSQQLCQKCYSKINQCPFCLKKIEHLS